MITNVQPRQAFALVATLFTVAVAGAAGCDRLDDVVDDILKGRDAGAGSDSMPEPQSGTCTADSDCRLTSDYCVVCQCNAIGAHDPVPGVCGVPVVECLVDPCRDKTAVCRSGKCVSVAAPTACASSAQCPANTVCTTEAGVCNRPPGCGPNGPCVAVCYGSCQPQ